MGAYINPLWSTKENWLNYNAIPSTSGLDTTWEETPKGMLPVILVNNGHFTAAAIAYSPEELKVFLDKKDTRPKTVYFAYIKDLHSVSPELKHYHKE